MSEFYEAAHDKTVKRWLNRLQAEEKEHGDFRKEAQKAVDIYERKGDAGKKTVFPMYTANVNILHAALFSKMPRPDVRRPDQNRGSKELAEAIQRGIEHLQDTEDYSMPAHRAVSEWLSGGLGVVWYSYEPEIIETPIYEPVMQEVIDPITGQIVEQPVLDPETGEPLQEALRDEDGKLIVETTVESQTITQQYHPWHRFRWEPAVTWEDVDWISFDYVKTESQIKADYDVKLNNLKKKGDDFKAASADAKGGHLVHHIWCRKTKKVYVITPAHKSALDEYEDPLGLEDFFPCPRPLMMNVQCGSITPRPDYVYIEKQHDNIQTLTRRINKLTEGVKDIGFFEASVFEELAAISDAPDGRYIGIEGMLDRLNGNSAANVVASVDMTNKVNTIDRLRQQREDEKNIIYELQGIADIVRGASVASETATAQAIKDKHFQVRLSEKINELRRYWRDAYRILTELMGEHFTPQSFTMFTGMDLSQQELDALKNELGRSYMIDVETEDTTFEDDEKERQQGIELIRVMGEVIGQHLPAVQAGALPADVMTQLLTFGTNLFRQGRVLEDSLASLPDTASQFEQLNQTMQEMQGQIDQMGMENEQIVLENQQLQQALQAMQEQSNQVDTAGKVADIRKKSASAERDAAEAEQTRFETLTGMF
jgi:regulator of replication initiation timing